MKSILDGENRWVRGSCDGSEFECEEEKEGLDGGYSVAIGKVVQNEVGQDKA